MHKANLFSVIALVFLQSISLDFSNVFF